MVTTTEMRGLQGWFLKRLGCFPVDQQRPSMTTLRLAIDLLAAGQQVVVFPEGRIQRRDQPIKLHLGLVRLAQLAQRRGVSVPVIPVGLATARPHHDRSAGLPSASVNRCNRQRVDGRLTPLQSGPRHGDACG